MVGGGVANLVSQGARRRRLFVVLVAGQQGLHGKQVKRNKLS